MQLFCITDFRILLILILIAKWKKNYENGEKKEKGSSLKNKVKINK